MMACCNRALHIDLKVHLAQHGQTGCPKMATTISTGSSRRTSFAVTKALHKPHNSSAAASSSCAVVWRLIASGQSEEDGQV